QGASLRASASASQGHRAEAVAVHFDGIGVVVVAGLDPMRSTRGASFALRGLLDGVEIQGMAWGSQDLRLADGHAAGGVAERVPLLVAEGVVAAEPSAARTARALVASFGRLGAAPVLGVVGSAAA